MTDGPFSVNGGTPPRLRVVGDEPPRRGPGKPKGLPKSGGRQKGAGNLVSASTRATAASLLDRRGQSLVQKAINIALGLKMRVGPVAGPDPQYAYPSEASQLKALELCFRKLLPDLSAVAQEITGADGTAIFPAEAADSPRELAKSLLSIIATGAPDGSKITLDPPGTHVARFRDAALGERILPNTDTPLDDAPEPEPPPAQLGERIVIDRRIAIRFVEVMPDGREKWTLGRVSEETGSGDQLRYVILEYAIGREAAERRAMQLIKDGKA